MNKKAIITALSIWIPLIIIWLLIPTAVKQHQISSLQNDIVSMNTQIEQYSWLIKELQIKHDECSTKQEERHNTANRYRTEQQVLRWQISWVENELWKLVWLTKTQVMDNELMQKICDKAPKSPLCWDNELLEHIKKLPHYKTLIWISYAESHIWMSFAPHYWCAKANNWAWLKRAKFDDGSVSEKYNIQYKGLDKELQGYLSWCYLYAFDTVEDYFKSLSNTIELWYAVCDWDPQCIVKSYVGKDSQDWVKNVNSFIN